MITDNNLIIIDCWEHLHHPLETAAKSKIADFLRRIEGLSHWHVYVHNGKHAMDTDIADILEKGDFSVKFDCDDPLVCYNNNGKNKVNRRFFYSGFHANWCLFYKPIGIENYWQIADTRLSSMHILSDLTVGYLENYHFKQLYPTLEIPFITAKHDTEGSINRFNYRNHVIRQCSMLSSQVDTC
jgi:hypothetical protein